MTKAGGFLTPKAISNRIKSKGLQKLRWYCQMCQKQCRDENGMKCHMRSEGHLRAMKVFSDNPGRIIDDFSQQFIKGFLDVLSHRHGTKRVQANRVYQEYIGDKNHVHMNSTCWSSLTGLCKFLGKEGKCVVDETEKGWFIQWIERDPKLLAKQAQLDLRQSSELDEEERIKQAIEAQIEASRVQGDDDEDDAPGATELQKDDNDVPLTLSLSVTSSKRKAPVSSVFGDIDDSVGREEKSRVASVFSAEDETEEGPASRRAFASAPVDGGPVATSSRRDSSSAPAVTQHGTSAIENIRQEEVRRLTKLIEREDEINRKDYWLHPGIIVKILNKKLSDGKYYKEKANVLRVIDHYVGEVRVNSTGAIIRLDQADLETVVPKERGSCLIVNGRARGCHATVLRINEDAFNCDVRVLEGVLAGRDLIGVDYEDLSRIDD